MRSTVEAGGASPDNARRSGPPAVTSSWLLARLVDGRRPGRGAGGRGSGVTAGTAGGRSPGPRCAAGRRAVGLASEGRGEAAAPQRRDPRVNPGRLRRVSLAAHSPRLLASVLAALG